MAGAVGEPVAPGTMMLCTAVRPPVSALSRQTCRASCLTRGCHGRGILGTESIRTSSGRATPIFCARLNSTEVNVLRDSCAYLSKQEIQSTTCGKNAGISLRRRKAMAPTISARAPQKRTQRDGDCEILRYSGFGCATRIGFNSA
jgi:hypothetical protein